MLSRLVAFLPVLCACVSAQSLKITSPADGAVVKAGQELKITVAATGKFQTVVIIGTGPIGVSMMRSAPPYDFIIKIPDKISPGKYGLTADGFTSPGHRTGQDRININVERAGPPFRLLLKVQPSSVQLAVRGGVSLKVVGVTPDGYTMDLSSTGQLSFKSSSPGIATVDASSGLVLGVAPGSAKITVMYARQSVDVPVAVVKDSRMVIKVDPPVLRLSVGGQRTLRIYGVTAEGNIIELNRNRPQITSDRPGIVAAGDVPGLVRALAPGTAKITVTLFDYRAEIPVTVVKGGCPLVRRK